MAKESTSYKPSPNSRSLEYVFVVSRHGQRTPASRCTRLPDTTDLGQLTPAGREQTAALGRFLKARYGSLLSGQPGEVLATHNKYQRTRDSVVSTLEALGTAPTTPVPDNTRYDLVVDKSIADNYEKIMNTPSTGHFKNLREVVDFVATESGSPVEPKKVKLLCLDSLMTCVANGNPIPDWAKPYWDELLSASHVVFTMSLIGAERRMATCIIKVMLETLSDKYDKGLAKKDKMHLFSMSDLNLYSIVKLLNPQYDRKPDFCFSLMVEIFTEGGYPMAEVFFVENLDPKPLRLEKLRNPCVLADFVTELRRLQRID
ncbi:putative acid phosphatase 5 [Ornithodoros turicata]|uniref:putative acid phosphatase 5 n=1 Tax=Ornithodoros turicata TaxID=34597 RepID=UPI003138F7A8